MNEALRTETQPHAGAKPRRHIQSSTTTPPRLIRWWARPAMGVAMIGAAYWFARPASPPSPAPERFSFSATVLPAAPAIQETRRLHPDYEKLNGWISSVGAAASLGDLDNDGFPDECALVDPRSDRVTLIKLQQRSAKEDTTTAPAIFALLDAPHPVAASAPMGTVIGDFDGDGWPDVLVYYWGRLPVIFRNPGSTHSARWEPVELTAKSFDGVEKCFTNCVTQADIDGDGRVDLVIGNYFPSRADVLNVSGVPGTQEMQSSMSDATNGGRNFILLNRSRGPGEIAFEAVPVELSDAGGPMAAERAERVMAGWTLAVGAMDLDGDLRPEIYVANDFGPDRLLVNESTPGRVRFILAEGSREWGAPKSKTLGRDSFKGMGVDFAALDGDAVTILVSNIANRWALLESHFAYAPTTNRDGLRAELHRGRAPYHDRSEPLGISRSGWGWDIKAADFDNDGALEIVQALGFLAGKVDRWAELQELASGNDFFLSRLRAWPLFRHEAANSSPDGRGARMDKISGDSHLAFFARKGADGAFTDIGAELGFPARTVSRGIAIADVDHDGRLDFVLANQWGNSFFYHNHAPQSRGHYVGLQVLRAVGQAPLHAALVENAEPFPTAHFTPMIGARVTLKKDGRILTSATVDGGNGHSGRRAAEVHFGVSDIDAGGALSVSIEWIRNGKIQRAELPVAAAPTGESRGWQRVTLSE